MSILVTEATEFKFEVRCDLQGHLEITMASKATNIAGMVNIPMYSIGVIKVADYKSYIKFNLSGYLDFLEATKASEAIKMAVIGNIHIYFRAIKVSNF